MTFRVHIHASARHDFARATAYYDAEAPAQTARFIAEFFQTAARLGDFPYSGPELRGGARRSSLHVFPYQIWYRVAQRSREVEIIAVLHHRQEFTEFEARLSDS